MSRQAPRTWPLQGAGAGDTVPPPARLAERSAATASPLLVSVIIVNWNGKEHLDACFSSLAASDYPADRLELLCVDNGSTDGSTAHLAARFPAVRIVALTENRGFTGGNEAGVAASRGDVLVFLNNDMRVEPDAIRRLVGRLGPGVACAAARVLSWNGRAIDFIRGTINFEGRGYQEDHGDPSSADRSSAQPTFFPNGGAFAVTREAYDRSGGFDPAFFAYYDDVDLGWRLRIVGSDIQVVKEAVVYHRHGATGRKHPSGQKRYLLERNALWTVFKCYGAAALRRTLGAALLLATRRVLQDVRPAALGAAPGFDAPLSSATPPSWKGIARESYAALAVAAAGLPAMAAARRWVHARRTTPDDAILPAFGRALEYSSRRSSYMAVHDSLSAELALPHVLRGKPRVLIITHESLKRNMSGPAIRALELGRALGRSAHVTVAAPGDAEIAATECVLASYTLNDDASIRVLAEKADIMVVWGLTVGSFPFLRHMQVPLVIDLYCPFTLEYLEMKATDPGAEATAVARQSASLLMYQNELLEAGDFFICASERQRDFWLGALHTAGRINTHTYAADATLRQLIDVVPFGLQDEPIETAAARAQLPAHVLKGRYPGIGPDDKVLLWGGSMLDWQDPEVIIKAVAEIARHRTDVKLFFIGTKHPNPYVVPARVVERSQTLARNLGLLDTHVFFNDWVPYEERAAYLLDADIGVSTHTDHLETRFAFRTRMLDYMWARLPIVCTAGDHFGDLVQREGLGRAVAPGDPRALAAAILELLDDAGAAARCRERLGALASDLRWSQVVRPLERYVDRGGFAPDRDRVVQAMQRELRSSYKWTKWAKRTALALGIGEGSIEQVKGTLPVRAAMALRNRSAHWKATRKARDGR
jgi:GT2 family glycosyltransferase/glycosyltransferase involved in cell wall biosynthesis